MSEEQRSARRAAPRRRRGAAPAASKISFPPSDGGDRRRLGQGRRGQVERDGEPRVALAAEGHRVGVLDADVWGFSVPRMLGVSGKPVGFNDMILPLEAHGVKVISMGFFVPEETPVIWRGPMLHKAIEQFLGDVYWGDLDFLLCDLPPGTGDVSISLASFLPGASMLVVTTPQEAARKVAERAGKMAERTNLRPLGVIENMSLVRVPALRGARAASSARAAVRKRPTRSDVPLMAQVPLLPALREGGDAGVPIVVAEPDAAGERGPARGRHEGGAGDEDEGRQAAHADDVAGPVGSGSSRSPSVPASTSVRSSGGAGPPPLGASGSG